MLVLKRRDGDWIDVTHAASGDVLRIRVYAIDGPPGRANLAFDDDPRNFLIERPERARFAFCETRAADLDHIQPGPVS